MRDLNVYTSEEKREKEEYNFNFVKLYHDYKQNPTACLEEENTQHFLNFIETFSYKPLTKEEKVERIAQAGPWSGKEELNTKLLTDKLRYIVSILHSDVKQQKPELLSIVEVGKVSAESIAYELENISSQISGREIRKVNSETFNEIMKASDETSYGKAQDAFFRRVAYFAMTRLLLARVWEDIGFIEESLYNGGFAKWYINFNHEIRRVLHYAFELSAERYPWLFNVNNNYSWYEPSDDALIDSLYELSNFYLGKLNQDILGNIYEDYIEKVDKKNKGQYYTPREIVYFIWDRVGYNNPKAFFWHSERGRKPNYILDPATGSGGFLVEAARRIRESTGFDWNEPQDLKDIHDAILWGIFGSEISSFPYYLTQVNLLIQLTPVIKKILELTRKTPRESPTPLGVICEDSLELHNVDQSLFPVQIKEKKEEYQNKILRFTTVEKKIYDKIKDEYAGKFSYCCANPPYVGEKGHKELFRHTLRAYPYWKTYYQGKMDYLYWFIILGLSKLRDYGKLGFITSAYWPTADGASGLRKYILENAKIKEMIFFEEVKIFEHAKGQHNMIFVLTKCSGKEHKEERENNHIKIVQVKSKNKNLPGTTIRENLSFLTKRIQKYIEKPKYEDEYIKVFWSGVKQGDLSSDGGPWNVKFSKKTESVLENMTRVGDPLIKLAKINSGVDVTISCLTENYVKSLPIQNIQNFGLQIGDGVYVLNKLELQKLNLDKHELMVVKPFIKNSQIDKYIVDQTEEKFLIYLDWNSKIDDYPKIKQHLEKFKLIMENQITRYEESYSWWAIHRPREQEIFEGAKIVNPQHTQEPSFAYYGGPLYASRDVYYIKLLDQTKENIFYLLAILNSRLIKMWLTFKGKKKGSAFELKTTPLSKIPIRRINFNDPKEARIHDEIVDKVKSIRENIAKLAQYSKYFYEPRLTKLEFEANLPNVNNEAIIRSISSENLYNLRTHPKIKIEKPEKFEEEKFYLSRVDKIELTLTSNFQLSIKGKNGTSVFIEGPEDLLNLFVVISSNWEDKSWKEIKENLLLPDNVISFNALKTKILSEVKDIRTKILKFQKEIDQIVNKLYGLVADEIRITEG